MVADPPYRVAYVIGELGKGGAEYQLYELLRHLDRRRFTPRVFVLAPGGWWVEPIRDLGVPVEEIPRRGPADVRRLARLRVALRRFAPHVMHAILWSGNSYGRLAALGLGIPVVIAAERVVPAYRAWQVMVERALDRVTDAYLVNCEAIAAWQVERRRLQRDRRLVAGVGRLDAQKDFPTFLRAAAMIAADFPDVDFLVVGEGEEQAALEALARRLGLGARVVFTGLRHDVPRLLAAVDVLVLTSLYEGFPNVLLEAMATGAVAVATDVGGCRELVTSGETGVLVPPRAPAAVAAAVGRVLRDPALARRLATAARQRVEGAFSVDVMARRTMDAYLRRLDATRAPAAVAAA